MEGRTEQLQLVAEGVEGKLLRARERVGRERKRALLEERFDDPLQQARITGLLQLQQLKIQVQRLLNGKNGHAVLLRQIERD